MRPLWKVCLPLALALPIFIGSEPQFDVHTFAKPIDALSIHIDGNTLINVRAQTASGWTPWQQLHMENEQDPMLTESNLVMFPESVSAIEFDHAVATADMHPITVSTAPVHYSIASTNDPGTPTILTRDEWGADPSLLYTTSSSSSSADTTQQDENATNPEQQSGQRIDDCLQAQQHYPQEFKVSKTVTTDTNGQRLRWPHQYSPSIKLFVVHHTAISVSGDTRSGVDEVRALYQYHANSRGWGDVGYHYLIDRNGQIYEGKSGGLYVVGGHAYCNNIGTIGIAMLGNFDEEDPSQAQVHSLQWLLHDLGNIYHVDVSGQVEYHGITHPTIVGHRDLLSTDCPGYFLYGALDQIRNNVIADTLIADVNFPAPPDEIVSNKPFVDQSQVRRQQRLAQLGSQGAASTVIQPGITALGSNIITGRPGDEVVFSVRYRAPSAAPSKGDTIATVTLPDPTTKLWEDVGGAFATSYDELTLPDMIPANGTTQIRLKVALPVNPGTSTMQIGNATFQLVASGRRQLGARGKETLPSGLTLNAMQRAVQRRNAMIAGSSSSAITVVTAATQAPTTRNIVTPVAASSSSVASISVSTQSIRVRLTRIDATLSSCSAVDLTALQAQYRGTLSCQTIGSAPAVIDTLPIEDYMKGLGEEPDSEPYEKQRAFAIAARTYAVYYLSPGHRKFPGMPYDASDDPATFQRFIGIEFENTNPNWLQAVASTSGEVITKDNQVIKPPYFSSDDGTTRTPAQAGWTNFPFAEIFTSKPDPWCQGMPLNGHGVGMSGCGAAGQARQGKTAEQILAYYYPTTTLTSLNNTLVMR